MPHIRVIDFVHDAQPEYYAVIALPEAVKIVVPETRFRFFTKMVEMEIDYRLTPVLFWASMYMVEQTEEGEGRGNSVIVPMVQFADGIEAAPVIDGYVGILTPNEDGVDSTPRIRNAINEWRAENQKTLSAVKQKMN